MNKNFNFYYKELIVLLFLFFFITCQKKQTKPIFDLNTPGGEVMNVYDDGSPQVVFYYKIDVNGKKTQEKIGEAYFYNRNEDDKIQEFIGGGMKDNKREGKWYAFFKDGSVQTEAFYINGIEHGAYNVYRDNGKPLYKGHYDHGNCDGIWYWYDEKGTVIKKIKADKNTIVCGYCSRCLQLKNK